MNLNSKSTIVFLAVVILLVSGVGCSLPGAMIAPTATAAHLPTSPTPLPTATSAPPPVAPMPEKEQAEAANALENQIIAVYETVGASVVNITNKSYVYDIFGRAFAQQGSGSGFVYDAQGHIVTNYHVIENASELLVTLADGQSYDAKVVGVDPANDLAVIKIDAGENLPAAVALADSDTLRVGQFVVAIGSPFGQNQTLTTGVISALGRIIKSPTGNFIGEALQTDAAINPGNSGGPLLDLQGRVIGVNSQIISPSGASAGIGFAVSSNTVRHVAPELISRGYYPHPWLGVNTKDLAPAMVAILRKAGMDIPVEAGLFVLQVTEGGPADQAGVQGVSNVKTIGRYRVPTDGDIIIAIDGQPVDNLAALTLYLDTQTAVGDTVQLTVIRDGQDQVIPVTLQERPPKE